MVNRGGSIHGARNGEGNGLRGYLQDQMILIVIIRVTATPAAEGRVWRVPTEAPTVQAGIDSAVAGDEVTIACGLYLEHGIRLKSGVDLTGETGQPECVTIDAQQLDRVLSGVAVSDIRISGLTLTGGYHVSSAGLYLAAATGITVDGCILQSNVAHTAGGGGMVCNASSGILIANCRFENNEAMIDAGGGAMFIGGASGAISHCAFSGNRAVQGGGLACHGSSPEISACRFEANEAAWGGGIDFQNSSAAISHCLLRGNSAGRGGAVSCYYGTDPTLSACSLLENTGTLFGGAIHLGYASGECNINAVNCDIFANSAPIGPDGHAEYANTLARLTCCLVDLTRWAGAGTITQANDGCQIETKSVTWGQAKALYR
jgi:hypothetical protein